MNDRQRPTMKGWLDRLLATRARRDREERFSEPWRAADTELHEIEHAIFRMPLDEPEPTVQNGRHRASRIGRHLRRASTVMRSRAIQGGQAR